MSAGRCKRTARVNWRMSLRGRLLWVVNCHELISLVRMCVRLTGRPVHRPFRGLLDVHSWSGLHTRAVTAIPDTLHRRLQPFRYLRSRSSCCPLWRLPRRTCTLESAAFSRRTPGGRWWLTRSLVESRHSCVYSAPAPRTACANASASLAPTSALCSRSAMCLSPGCVHSSAP